MITGRQYWSTSASWVSQISFPTFALLTILFASVSMLNIPRVTLAGDVMSPYLLVFVGLGQIARNRTIAKYSASDRAAGQSILPNLSLSDALIMGGEDGCAANIRTCCMGEDGRPGGSVWTVRKLYPLLRLSVLCLHSSQGLSFHSRDHDVCDDSSSGSITIVCCSQRAGLTATPASFFPFCFLSCSTAVFLQCFFSIPSLLPRLAHRHRSHRHTTANAMKSKSDNSTIRLRQRRQNAI